MRLVQRAWREARNVAEHVGQTDIFSGSSIHRISEAFLRLMFRNDRPWISPESRDKLADALRFYLTEARKTSAASTVSAKRLPVPSLSSRSQGSGNMDQNEKPKTGSNSDRVPMLLLAKVFDRQAKGEPAKALR